MDLPVKFPSETEVILEDVARSRALSLVERVRSYRGFLISAARISRLSPKADWAASYAEEQELLAETNIREFSPVMDINRGLWGQELDQAVVRLAESFAAHAIRHALIGGLATSLRGRERTTKDADFLIDVPQLQLPGVLDDLIGRGFTLDPAIVIPEYTRRHITSFTFGAIRIDWLKPVLPLYARTLTDARSYPWSEDHTLFVATAEGLILTKMVAFRPLDQIDITTLLTANRDTIDIVQIREEWSPFAAIEATRTAWLEGEIERLIIRRE